MIQYKERKKMVVFVEENRKGSQNKYKNTGIHGRHEIDENMKLQKSKEKQSATQVNVNKRRN